MSDLRYALRSLARTPGFTAVAVLVISLGVGTTTASFSIANWLLLRPVPGVHDDGRLATVWFGHWSDGGGVSPSFLSYPNYADVMRRVTALSGLAGYQVASAAVGGCRGPQRQWWVRDGKLLRSPGCAAAARARVHSR